MCAGVCECIVSYSQKRVICKAVAQHFRQSELLLHTLRLQRQTPATSLGGRIKRQPFRPTSRPWNCRVLPSIGPHARLFPNMRPMAVPALPRFHHFAGNFWTWVTSFKALFAVPRILYMYPVYTVSGYSRFAIINRMWPQLLAHSSALSPASLPALPWFSALAGVASVLWQVFYLSTRLAKGLKTVLPRVLWTPKNSQKFSQLFAVVFSVKSPTIYPTHIHIYVCISVCLVHFKAASKAVLRF